MERIAAWPRMYRFFPMTANALFSLAFIIYCPGAASAELHFKTASREILLNDVRRPDANEKTAFLNGWSCQERGTALLRSGTAGAMTTEKNVP